MSDFRVPRTMFLASRTLFRPRIKSKQAPPPPPLPLKYLETRRRIFFRVDLYKFICKETWYRAPNISTVEKYQKTVRNLSAMVLTIALQRPVHTIRCNLYHTILLYYYVDTNKIIHACIIEFERIV